MQNKTFVIDLDGTLIKGQSQRYLIEYLKEIKKISFLKYFMIMLGFVLYKLSIYKNAAQLLQFSLNNFKNEKEGDIYKYIDDFFNKNLKDRYFNNSKSIIKLMKDSGHKIIILSAVIDPLVKRICDDLNIVSFISTKLEFDNNGLFTGRIVDKQNYGNQKLDNIRKYLFENNLNEEDVIVLTDHESDIPIIKYFTNSIVTNPDLRMNRWARQNNYPVIYLNNNESIQYIKHYIESK
jgi:HAD superfamily hydrolase (TIGR01490 family)